MSPSRGAGKSRVGQMVAGCCCHATVPRMKPTRLSSCTLPEASIRRTFACQSRMPSCSCMLPLSPLSLKHTCTQIALRTPSLQLPLLSTGLVPLGRGRVGCSASEDQFKA
jgi:hypothetical protein